MSLRVSRKPVSTVSGVRSSCEMLATKLLAHGLEVREVRGVVCDHQFLEAAERNDAYRERTLRLRGEVISSASLYSPRSR